MNFLNRFVKATLLVGMAAIPAAAQRESGLVVASVAQAVTRPLPAVEDLSVSVDLSTRILQVRSGDTVIRSYPVSVGGEGFPTPRGEFRVSRLLWNPSWRPPASAWARDRTPEAPGSPGNPMGRVKIFFQEPDFYLHGTGLASSLGRPASHGCIRLRNADAAELARLMMVAGGSERDQEWFEQMLANSGTTREVRLSRPVTLRIRA